jgi:hypothetical protein
MGYVLAPNWREGDNLSFHISRMNKARSRRIGWSQAGWQAFLNSRWFIGGRTKRIVLECVKEWTENVLRHKTGEVRTCIC